MGGVTQDDQTHIQGHCLLCSHRGPRRGGCERDVCRPARAHHRQCRCRIRNACNGAGQRCSPLHQQRGRNLCLQLSPTDPPRPACRRLTQLQVHPPVATGVGQSSASEAPFTLLPVTACTVHSDLRVTGTTRVYGFAAVPVPLLALTRRVIGFKLAPSVGLQQGQGQAGLRLGLKHIRNRLR